MHKKKSQGWGSSVDRHIFFIPYLKGIKTKHRHRIERKGVKGKVHRKKVTEI
jgi:hypothetical protein